jgi:predicted nicotinamide N-methyase
MNKVFASVKRKFNSLPDPAGFSISLTPGSYVKILDHFDINATSVLFEIGSGKGFPCVYAAIAGFTKCFACDISPESVLRTQHVVQQCQRDARFSSLLEITAFDIQTYDGLERAIPASTTHVQSIIAWTDAQLQTLISLVQAAPQVRVLATLASPKQQRLLEAHFTKLAVISVSLESSGEKRQVMVLQCP